MAKRKFILKEQERKELRRAGSQTDKVPDLQRLQADRVYGEGKPVQEILGMVGGSWRSLMAWYQRCRAEGGTGLASKYQGQNAAKLSRQQRWDLVEKLNQYRARDHSPGDTNHPRPMIQRLAVEDRRWGAKRIRVELKRLGYCVRTPDRTTLRYFRILQHYPKLD